MKNTVTFETSTVPIKGWSRQKVISELKKRLKKDLSFSSRRIVGSMCTRAHPFAQALYCQNMEKNLGDPGLFEGTAQIESEVIKMLGTMLGYSNTVGNVVSGGTEANIVALWAIRNFTSNPHKNEIIISKSAHFSFDKAANLLNLKLIKISHNDHFQIDIKKVKKTITNKTLAIIGIAGTSDLGVVDPIPELSRIALEHNLHLHVDASFGGFVLPFINKTDKSEVPAFDFRLAGVSSITLDPHKMGLATIPAGVILFRNPELMKKIQMKVDYLAGGKSPQTLLGTRPGASAIVVWSLLKHLGINGYGKIVQNCMALTDYFVQEVEKIGSISVVCKPTLNIVGIKSNIVRTADLSIALRQKGWAISQFPNHIRIVIMPHIKLSHLCMLIKDLKEIIRVFNKEKREYATSFK